jgi:hypothetical protein
MKNIFNNFETMNAPMEHSFFESIQNSIANMDFATPIREYLLTDKKLYEAFERFKICDDSILSLKNDPIHHNNEYFTINDDWLYDVRQLIGIQPLSSPHGELFSLARYSDTYEIISKMIDSRTFSDFNLYDGIFNLVLNSIRNVAKISVGKIGREIETIEYAVQSINSYFRKQQTSNCTYVIMPANISYILLNTCTFDTNFNLAKIYDKSYYNGIAKYADLYASNKLNDNEIIVGHKAGIGETDAGIILGPYQYNKMEYIDSLIDKHIKKYTFRCAIMENYNAQAYFTRILLE